MTSDNARAGLLLLSFAAVALVCRESLRSLGDGARLGFPSLGLAIAALIALGWKWWPFVVIGVLLAASITDLGFPLAILPALGQSLAALGAAKLLLKILPINPHLHRIRDLLRLFLVGAVAAAASAAMASFTIHYLALPTRDPPPLWLAWWASDTLSVALLGAPALIFLDPRPPILQRDLRYWCHLAAFVAVAALLLVDLYFSKSPTLLDLLLRPYLIFPLVIWAAFAFDRKVTALVTALLVVVILHGSLETRTGPLAPSPLDLIRLWTFCILAMATGLGAAQLLDENRRAMAAIDHSREQATHREAELRDANEAAQRLANELKQRERLMRTLYDTTSVGICVIDSEGRLGHVNQRMAIMFGYSTEEITGMEYVRLVYPEERRQGLFSIHALLQQETDLVERERHYVRQDGSEFWGHVMGRPLIGENGSAIGVVVTIADVTLQYEADKNQRLSAKVFESSNEGIVITDARHRILQVNQAFTRITGYVPEDVLGCLPNILSSNLETESFYERMRECLLAEGQWSGEVTNRKKTGEVYTEWLTINAVRDENQTLTNYVAVFSDVTQRKRDEARIRHLAQYDYLTDLPNRAALYDRLRQVHASAERYQRQYGVIFLDLDNFKPINDEYGHDTGDALLRQVSHRLRENVRAADTVARHGGDEFVILVPELQTSDEARSLADKLLSIVGQPYLIANRLLAVTPSIGIALYPDHGADPDSLVRAADLAMYEAKHRGRNKVVVANRSELCGDGDDNAATRN
ncbi:MAG TPA: diguanylate cyclase [Rhodocyclaceae bacterium]|nr:diguanylate cyclase [Rhodocyclaceae bacterium]